MASSPYAGYADSGRAVSNPATQRAGFGQGKTAARREKTLRLVINHVVL